MRTLEEYANQPKKKPPCAVCDLPVDLRDQVDVSAVGARKISAWLSNEANLNITRAMIDRHKEQGHANSY